MALKYFIVFASICFGVTLGSDCKSPQGETCLTKDEVGMFGSYMKIGDPCFLMGKNRWCFVSKTGDLHPCDCKNPNCGCQKTEDVKPPAPAPPAPAGDVCMSTQGNTCLTKDKVGNLGQLMVGGDPCFLSDNNRWCFVSTAGNMEQCDCKNASCGCQKKEDIKPPPNCDNSAVPKTFDCDKDIYCGSGYGADNTLCKYCGVDAKNCNKVCQHGLTDEEKERIVAKHNELRRKVAKGEELRNNQPSAANMNELIWDDDLAFSAQRWNDQCVWKHDVNRNLPEYKSVGQNMYRSKAPNAIADTDVEAMVQNWYDEVKDFTPSNINPFVSTNGTGHYTQVVWAETKYVGCGLIHYMKGDGDYKKQLTCNYGVGGNDGNTPMYQVGAAGSQCPNGDNDGLCT